MNAGVLVQSIGTLAVLSAVTYVSLRGARGSIPSARLKVAAASGFFLLASLVALVASEATEGSMAEATFVVFVVSLVVSTVLLIAAHCIPSGV